MSGRMVRRIVAGCGLVAVVANAGDPPPAVVLVWTGGGDGASIEDPANWSGPSEGVVVDPSGIAAWLRIDDPTAVVGGASGAPPLVLLDGGGLELRDGELTGPGVQAGLTGGRVEVAGGRLERRWLNDVDVRIEGWGRLELGEAFTPLRGGTVVDLGSTASGLDLRYCPRDRFLTDVAWRVRVNGAMAIPGVNLRVVSWNDDLGCSVSVVAGACPGDLDGDLEIDGADLGLLLAAWGSEDAEADVVPDGLVDGADLGVLLANWGTCTPGPIVPDCGDPGHCDLWYPAEG